MLNLSFTITHGFGSEYDHIEMMLIYHIENKERFVLHNLCYFYEQVWSLLGI